MRAATLWELVTSGQARLLAAVDRLSRPFFLLSFLAAAHRSGLLALLRATPRTFSEIANALGISEPNEALEAWLELGASVGALRARNGRWALHGYVSRTLAQPGNEAVAALVYEFATLHHALIVEGPGRLKAGRGFAADETDAELIALTSRTVEPFIHDILRKIVPTGEPTRLLEVGCGSGTHIRFAAELNPRLTALGLDISPKVVASTRASLQDWGLSERAVVEVGNLLEREPEPSFDLVTLHQNIYYFPVSERVAVLRRASGWLAPKGRLLVSTSCRAPSPGFAVLNLWGAMTEGAGRLPDCAELEAAFQEVGLKQIELISPIAPAKGFVGIVGSRP